MVAKLTYVEAKGMSVSFIITTFWDCRKIRSNGHRWPLHPAFTSGTSGRHWPSSYRPRQNIPSPQNFPIWHTIVPRQANNPSWRPAAAIGDGCQYLQHRL